MQKKQQKYITSTMSGPFTLTDDTADKVILDFLKTTNDLKDEIELLNALAELKTHYLCGTKTFIQFSNKSVDEVFVLNFIYNENKKERILTIAYKIKNCFTSRKKIEHLNF